VEAKDIQSVRELLQSVSESINSLGIYPRRNVCTDAVLLALLSKTIRTGMATCVLIEQGFGDEAFGLSRTLIELACSARYILNDPDSGRRSKRFIEYFAKDHETLTKMIQKHHPTLVPKYHADHDKMLETARTFKSPHSWHDGSVRDMVVEDDLVELDDYGQPAKWEYDYEVVYKWTSHFVHGTVVALDAHSLGPGTAFTINAGHQRIDKAGMALFNVAMYLFKSTVLTFRGLGNEMQKDLADRFDSVIRPLARKR